MTPELIAQDIEEGLHLLPPHMHRAVLAFFVERRRPGSFLSAVLQNDFAQAVGHADELNFQALRYWPIFLVNHAPSISWGSRELFEAWIAGGEDAQAGKRA